MKRCIKIIRQPIRLIIPLIRSHFEHLVRNGVHKRYLKKKNRIFHELEQKLIKHLENFFSVLRGVNGMPPNTLNNFFDIFFINFS